jgi:uncharacterized membrane protein
MQQAISYLLIMIHYDRSLNYAFISLLLLITSCANHEYEAPYSCPETPVSYQDDVHSIIVNKCATTGCHNGDGNPNGPGIDRNWLEFAKLQTEAQDGKVKEYVVNHIMPPSDEPQLTNEEISIIACWVDQGAPNN